MANASSSLTLVLNVFFICLAIAVALYGHKLFRSLPIGLAGDMIVSVLAIAAFAAYCQTGWDRLLLELDDDYPKYFRFAYMPFVAFVAIGFVRSLVPLVPAGLAHQLAAMTSIAPEPVPSGAGPSGGTPAPAQAPKPPSKLMKWVNLIAAIFIIGAIALVLLAKLITRNDLPYCDSQVTRNTLSDIFKSKSIEVKRYDSTSTLSSTAELVTCAASFTLVDDNKAEIEYSIYRIEGGAVQVKITKAVDK